MPVHRAVILVAMVAAAQVAAAPTMALAEIGLVVQVRGLMAALILSELAAALVVLQE